MKNIIFARCTYTKIPERRLLTTIEVEENSTYVYKTSTDIVGLPYLRQLIEQGNQVQEFIGSAADVVVGSITEDGRIRYPFINLPTVQYIICDQIDRGDISGAYRTIGQVVTWINQLDIIEDNPIKNTVLYDIYGDQLLQFSERSKCLRLGVLDLGADNLLYNQQTQRYSIIDHEMVIPGAVPIEIVIFRFVFFTLLRLGNIFDIHADEISLRFVSDGLLRVPEEWDISQWINESHISDMIALEERLQAYYTGRFIPWPRPAQQVIAMNSGRSQKNIAERLKEIYFETASLRHDLAEQQTVLNATDYEYKAYRQELEATNNRFEEYIAATKQAISEYQQELASAERRSDDFLNRLNSEHQQLIETVIEKRQIQRQFALHMQDQAHSAYWLEDELQKARQFASSINPPRTPLNILSPREIAKKYLSSFSVKLRKVLPYAKRGAKKIARRLIHKASSISTPLLAPSDRPSVNLVATRGASWTGPLLSVILPIHQLTTEQQQAILDSLAKQTYQSFEILLWDESIQQIWLLEVPEQKWDLRNSDIVSVVLGKYLCIATINFVFFPSTYIETSLISLESESLDFVVNSFDNAIATETALRSNKFPNTTASTWSLVIARAELFNSNLLFVLDRLPSRSQHAFVAGRILLRHPEKHMAPTETWAPASPTKNWDIAVQDHHILVRSTNHHPWGQVSQIIHPVDEIIFTKAPAKLKPRLLVLFPFLAVGGAEKLTLDVLLRLRERFEIVVVTVEPNNANAGSMVGEYQQLTPFVYNFPDILYNQLNFSMLAYLIDEYAIDTLFVANGAGWIYDAAQSIRQRYPQLHMVNQVYDHKIGWIDRYEPVLATIFNRHVAPNQSIVKAYIERGAQRDHIDLIYHGVDTAYFDPTTYTSARLRELRSEFNLPLDKPIVAFLARIHPQKRPLDFVALAQRFSEEEATFLMVGDGPLKAQIDDQIKQLHIAHLHTLPFYKPFIDVLAVADIVVILSEYEGLPLVLLNAQSLNRPVVATDVGAIREVINYTQGGKIIDKIGDINAAERAIRELLAGNFDMSNVRARLISQFDIEQVARLYGNALEQS